MPVSKGTRMVYRCSFCGKSQDRVQRLIAGPGGVYICDECVDLCREIIEDEKASQPADGESFAVRYQYPGSVKAFFAGLPTAGDSGESGESGLLSPTVYVEFIGRSGPQQVFLLGHDATGIVVRARGGDDGTVHFYPWSSIFSLTS